MSCSCPPCRSVSVAGHTVISTISHGRHRLWVRPAWYRVYAAGGEFIAVPIAGWRLWRHRLLWGYCGLVDAR